MRDIQGECGGKQGRRIRGSGECMYRIPTVSEKSVKKNKISRSGNCLGILIWVCQGNLISFLKSGKSQGILSSDFC